MKSSTATRSSTTARHSGALSSCWVAGVQHPDPLDVGTRLVSRRRSARRNPRRPTLVNTPERVNGAKRIQSGSRWAISTSSGANSGRAPANVPGTRSALEATPLSGAADADGAASRVSAPRVVVPASADDRCRSLPRSRAAWSAGSPSSLRTDLPLRSDTPVPISTRARPRARCRAWDVTSTVRTRSSRAARVRRRNRLLLDLHLVGRHSPGITAGGEPAADRQDRVTTSAGARQQTPERWPWPRLRSRRTTSSTTSRDRVLPA